MKSVTLVLRVLRVASAYQLNWMDGYPTGHITPTPRPASCPGYRSAIIDILNCCLYALTARGVEQSAVSITRY